jgi:transposase
MQEIDCDPEQMLGDKGYDSEAVRNDIEERGGEAAIPSTATRKVQHAVDKALYTLRNRIERFFNRAKNSRRLHPLRQADGELRRLRAACLHPNLD